MLTMNMIGNKIKEKRLLQSLSQEQLVDELKKHDINMSRETISKIENGSRSISALEMKAICEILKIDIDDLLKEEDEKDIVKLFRKSSDINNPEVLEELSVIQDMIKDFINQRLVFQEKVKIKKMNPLWKV